MPVPPVALISSTPSLFPLHVILLTVKSTSKGAVGSVIEIGEDVVKQSPLSTELQYKFLR